MSSSWGRTISSRGLGQTRQRQSTLLREQHERGEGVSGGAAWGGPGCAHGGDYVEMEQRRRPLMWRSFRNARCGTQMDPSPQAAETTGKGAQAVNGE